MPGPLIGIEQEFVVRRLGEALDFAPLLELVGQPPSDRWPGHSGLAGPLPGTVLSVDETEAELALPPIPTRPGFAGRLDQLSVDAREWLHAALTGILGPGVSLEGTSTHVSVSTPPELVPSVATVMASSFAPALVLLVDRPGSPGILTRAHAGRIELCGDFVAGRHLRAAALVALGGVLASVRALTDGGVERLPRLRLAVRRSSSDGAAGSNAHWTKGQGLHDEGRATRVRRADGHVDTLQGHLAAAWESARSALGDHVEAGDLEVVDRLVDGRDALPIELAISRGAGP